MSQPIVTEESDDAPEGEPSLDGLLDIFNAGNGGWSDLNQKTLGKAMQAQTEAQSQRMRKEASLFRECFVDNAAGRKVLQIFLNQTLRSATWPVFQVRDAEMLMAIGIWRESQNSFVAAIIEAIAVANNQQVQPRNEP